MANLDRLTPTCRNGEVFRLSIVLFAGSPFPVCRSDWESTINGRLPIPTAPVGYSASESG